MGWEVYEEGTVGDSEGEFGGWLDMLRVAKEEYTGGSATPMIDALYLAQLHDRRNQNST